MPPTIEQSLREALPCLSNQADMARLDAELLLAFVLEKNRTWLRTWSEKTLTPQQHATYTALLARRQAGEPVAYLTGTQGFWSLQLQVTADTLIPRPETELLVEQALARIPPQEHWQIADLGTGSGAIALALATERPACRFTATDVSDASLAIARHNARRHNLGNVQFVKSHWFANLPSGQPYQMIVSNPPYIAEQDPHLARGDVRFEPEAALASGPDGLEALRHIIQQGHRYLVPGGWLLLEHGFDQQDAVLALMQATGYHDVADHLDLSGQPRLVLGRTPG